MNDDSSQDKLTKTPNRRKVLFYIAAGICLIALSFVLERETGIPVETTMRVGAAGLCLGFIYNLSLDYPGERWPWIGFWLALLVNIGVFFTPLVKGPLSRGELMVFASPDAVVVLAARIFTYRVTDIHQRATRQTMILGLVVAIAFCAILFTLAFVDPRTSH